jgi:hypothetical protein
VTDASRGDFSWLNLCRSTLASGESCIVGICFFAGNTGALSTTLNVNDNAAGSPQTAQPIGDCD